MHRKLILLQQNRVQRWQTDVDQNSVLLCNLDSLAAPLVSMGKPPLANRHAAIGLAIVALVDRDKLVCGTFDLNYAGQQDLAPAVLRKEIGLNVALAGYDF